MNGTSTQSSPTQVSLEATSSQLQNSQRPRGPGLVESYLWISGYHFAQLIAAAILLLVLVVTFFDGRSPDWMLLIQVGQELHPSDIEWLLLALTGSATLGSLFLILPFAFWRLGPNPRRTLGTQRPEFRVLLLAAGAVLPLGILSDALYRAASFELNRLWLYLSNQWPQLASAEISLDSMALIQQQTGAAAYPLLLVVVGLGPAIGEEIIFRGLIGRGLINRWGLTRGVLLTSLLFAFAHVSPAHAIATLPIGIFLHVVYLATGSIWAPIFVHFLNNALAVTMMKYELGQHVQVSALLLGSAAMYVVAIAILLKGVPTHWQRIVPGFSANPPMTGPNPSSTTALKVTPAWLLVVAGSGVLCFTCTFVLAATGGG